MRIATANTYDLTISTLQKRQVDLQNQQQQLTSGKRVQAASDDPTGAARAERALATIGRVDANQRALEASRNGMTLAEGALGDANELLQQARETLVSAGNASYTDSERKGLADKLQGLRDQLLSIANRPDGAGGYLFSGQGAANPPFVDRVRNDPNAGQSDGRYQYAGETGVDYDGTAGTTQAGNLDNYQLTVDGRGAWMSARSGNGSFETSPSGVFRDLQSGELVTLPIDPATKLPLLNPNTNAVATGWLDSGRVVSPTDLTGDDYMITIAGSAPSQTYTLTNTTQGAVVSSGDFKPGQAIEAQGMSLTVAGNPADGDSFAVTGSSNDLKLFDALDKAIIGLNTPKRSPSEIAQANANALRDLDAVMGNLQTSRSQVGELMNNLDGSESRLSSLKVYSQSEQSAAVDLDMVQGLSTFQNQQSGYDTALKTYAMVQRLSLFQYIT
ncbi:MAG: flagellar hook-associated protein 3 [Roseateles depolymerans]|uniref:Flagellar hook-associated protein 3 n=1 Tax=Roseateles depolymerans TaxID=76731 RepID=A0A2W5DWL4_9BURK|nr:MAG: flagellar hook-associated protein 3 [Roseateles depolymerans]